MNYSMQKMLKASKIFAQQSKNHKIILLKINFALEIDVSI